MPPAQETARRGRALGIAALAMLASLGWTVGCTAMIDGPSSPAELAAALRNEVPAAPETLLAKFDRTIFFSDDGRHALVPRSRVEKWARPIEVVIVGSLSAANRRFVEDHFATLSRLTGLPITLRQGDGSIRDAVTSLDRHQANFVVAIDSRSRIDSLQAELGASTGERWVNRRAVCFFYASPRRGRLVEAFAAIPNVYRQSLLRHCIIEETTQALGLFADADMIQPSMFSERTPPMLSELTLNDKIIVRILYDPRIKPNMRREKALAVAQKVIAELIEAMAKDGPDALYQLPADASLEASRSVAVRGS